MTKTWLHVDINAYFATLTQQETPSLRGKPVGIVKGVGRTCIIAASKEAKKYGVKTGESWVDAKAKCPDLIPWVANFELAWSSTQRLSSLMNELSPDVEVFSLDEAFIDFTPLNHLYSSPQIFAQLLQKNIKSQLGEWVTCNVGIARTRLLAKMTSEVSPKGSITEVTEENKDALLASTSFDDVCGVGMRLGAKLARFGVSTPLQIAFIPEEELAAMVGPFWVKELQKISRGEDPLFLTRINRNQHAKSVGRSLTGYGLWRSRAVVEAVLYNLATEVVHKLRSMQLTGRMVYVSLRGSNQTGVRFSRHTTLTQPLCHLSEMFSHVKNLLSEWEFFPVIKCGVGLGLCTPADNTAVPLFGNWWRREVLHQAMDEVNGRYGLYTLRSGLLLDTQIVRPEVTGFLGDKQYQMVK